MKLSKFNAVLLVLYLLSLLSLQPATLAQSQNANNDSHTGTCYTIEKKYSNCFIDGYNVYVPESCTPESRAFPVIVFLQGGLAVGGEVDIVFNWGFPKIIKEASGINSKLDELRLNSFIVIMPHLRYGQFFHFDGAHVIDTIIGDVARTYNGDEKRIYLTGLSRGGHGTWGVASRIPERFAAIAPICGRPEGIDSCDTLVELPIWTSHNVGDDLVDYQGTVKTVEEIEQLSGKKFHRTSSLSDVKYRTNDRIFVSGKKNGHDAWTDLYNEANFYRWLLRFHK